MGPKFKIGDRVKSSHDESGSLLEGTVIAISDNYLVQFDGWEGGHNGDDGDSSTDKWYCDEYELTLVGEPQVNSTIQESIDSLILLEEVEGAHREESGNWFKSLLDLIQGEEEIIDFFSRYEKAYKDKASVTTMPTSYRTAKSCIVNAINEHIELGKEGLMSKSAIERATKEARKVEAKKPTPEELLGTIIKACDTITACSEHLTILSPQYKEAFEHVESTFNKL